MFAGNTQHENGNYLLRHSARAKKCTDKWSEKNTKLGQHHFTARARSPMPPIRRRVSFPRIFATFVSVRSRIAGYPASRSGIISFPAFTARYECGTRVRQPRNFLTRSVSLVAPFRPLRNRTRARARRCMGRRRDNTRNSREIQIMSRLLNSRDIRAEM